MGRGLFSRIFSGGPHSVLLYDGFGANGRALVQGRVLEDDPIPPADKEHAPWRNLVSLLRRADSDPIPHARVRVTVGTAVHEYHADDEGFFVGWMDASNAERLDDDWVRVGAELIAPASVPPVKAVGRALVPARRPRFLVISDVDDTVLQSNVTSFLLAVRTMLFENARTRLPFPGVAAFYQALRRGPSRDDRNPTFYVSSSPWNLYDIIAEFLEIQRIPAGPIMLRDVDIGLNILSSRQHHTHKREMIRRVLSTFPDLDVILIGDSGQQDPEIYRDVVRDYPGRIRAIYIRNVTMTAERARAIESLAAEVLDAGSSLLLADDTLTAAGHAAEHGFIAAESLVDVAAETRADQGPSGKKDVPGSRDASAPPTPTVVVE